MNAQINLSFAQNKHEHARARESTSTHKPNRLYLFRPFGRGTENIQMIICTICYYDYLSMNSCIELSSAFFVFQFISRIYLHLNLATIQNYLFFSRSFYQMPLPLPLHIAPSTSIVCCMQPTRTQTHTHTPSPARTP